MSQNQNDNESALIGGVGSRREARDRALALLYESEIKALEVEDLLAELPIDAEPYAELLVRGVSEHRADLDELIVEFAKPGWSISRMPRLDVAALRLGLYELVHRTDVPTSAVLSEWVELASTYSTDDSGRFVNGLLASAAEQIRG
ncbi:MAG: transcription antitermination factor NusB [Actinomycetia bacterium]|nr:transcription antitermination factor NusB [Actinomycetes bacterium]